jgi:hypothetical protein
MRELPIGLVCPQCLAAPGLPCRNAVLRALRKFHVQRWREMERAVLKTKAPRLREASSGPGNMEKESSVDTMRVSARCQISDAVIAPITANVSSLFRNTVV